MSWERKHQSCSGGLPASKEKGKLALEERRSYVKLQEYETEIEGKVLEETSQELSRDSWHLHYLCTLKSFPL